MRSIWLGVLVVGVLAGLCSCGHKSTAPAARAAQRFNAAVKAGNGPLACSLLTEPARSSVTGATDQSCADAVLNVNSDGPQIHDVQVWGDTAQVHIGADVVFLRQLKGGWRISAAGCRHRAKAPYECDVQG